MTRMRMYWPWQRTHMADIVFASGKTVTVEVWDMKVSGGGAGLTRLTSKDYKEEGYLFVKLDNIVGVFHRKGRRRWKGFGPKVTL